MSRAKRFSQQDGKLFLRQSFQLQQDVLAKQLEMAATSITHDPTYGLVTERHFANILRQYLPNRYSVGPAIVIDSNGATSDQTDVVIYDKQYTPTLLDQYDHRYVPAEAVYAVIEVKPRIDKDLLEYASLKAASVRKLQRTSVEFRTATGMGRNRLTYILAGIIAPKCAWKQGFHSEAFKSAHRAFKEGGQIDCGLALDTGCYDCFAAIEAELVPNGKEMVDDESLVCAPLRVHVTPQENCLMIFVFRLLRLLQFIGTVPAIDWNRYASVFDK